MASLPLDRGPFFFWGGMSHPDSGQRKGEVVPMPQPLSFMGVVLVYAQMVLITFGTWLMLYIIGRCRTRQGPGR